MKIRSNVRPGGLGRHGPRLPSPNLSGLYFGIIVREFVGGCEITIIIIFYTAFSIVTQRVKCVPPTYDTREGDDNWIVDITSRTRFSNPIAYSIKRPVCAADPCNCYTRGSQGDSIARAPAVVHTCIYPFPSDACRSFSRLLQLIRFRLQQKRDDFLAVGFQTRFARSSPPCSTLYFRVLRTTRRKYLRIFRSSFTAFTATGNVATRSVS